MIRRINAIRMKVFVFNPSARFEFPLPLSSHPETYKYDELFDRLKDFLLSHERPGAQ
jgi:hypothetical protein